MAAAGDRAAPGGVKLCFTQEYLDGAKRKVKRTAVKLAFYLAICNLEALALSTDHVGMSKWHLLCLILVFRYKLFLVLKRTTAPEGTRIPKESDEAIPSGLEIDDTDIKFNIITKEALAEMNVYKISGAAQGNCRPCG